MDIEQSNEPRMSALKDSEVIVRTERRRHWSTEEKLSILKETTQPGAIVAAIARRYGIGTGQLYTWRKQLLHGAMAGFVQIDLAGSEVPAKPMEVGRIDIRRGGDFTISIDRFVDRDALKLVLDIVGELER
ncbi:transposase [Gluconacetobacter sacchari DSM 12717]|nr:transposase [Gluconacetobacter sacchari DSM 12717]